MMQVLQALEAYEKERRRISLGGGNAGRNLRSRLEVVARRHRKWFSVVVLAIVVTIAFEMIAVFVFADDAVILGGVTTGIAATVGVSIRILVRETNRRLYLDLLIAAIARGDDSIDRLVDVLGTQLDPRRTKKKKS